MKVSYQRSWEKIRRNLPVVLFVFAISLFLNGTFYYELRFWGDHILVMGLSAASALLGAIYALRAFGFMGEEKLSPFVAIDTWGNRVSNNEMIRTTLKAVGTTLVMGFLSGYLFGVTLLNSVIALLLILHASKRIIWSALSDIVIAPEGVRFTPTPPDDAFLVGTTVPVNLLEPPRDLYVKDRHIFMSAPSGTGKSQTVMTALLSFRGQVVVFDPKGEYYQRISPLREKMGRKSRFLTLRPAFKGDDINLVKMLSSHRRSEAAAMELLVEMAGEAMYTSDQEKQENLPFVQPSIAMLKALAYEAMAQGKDPIRSAFVASKDLHARMQLLASETTPKAAPNGEAREYLERARYFASQAVSIGGSKGGGNYWQSVMGTFNNMVGIYAPLAAAIGGEPLRDEEDLYIELPLEGGGNSSRSAICSRFLLNAFWQYRVERGEKGENNLCYVIVDEALVLQPPVLRSMVAVGRSYKTFTFTIVQDFKNAQDLEALKDLHSIGNCALVLFPAASSFTDQYVMGLLKGFVRGESVGYEESISKITILALADCRRGVAITGGKLYVVEPALAYKRASLAERELPLREIRASDVSVEE